MANYYPQPQMPVWTMPNGDRWHLWHELLADALWLAKEQKDGSLSLERSYTVGAVYIANQGGVEVYAPAIVAEMNKHLAAVYGEGPPADANFPSMDTVTAALVNIFRNRVDVDGYRLRFT